MKHIRLYSDKQLVSALKILDPFISMNMRGCWTLYKSREELEVEDKQFIKRSEEK